jgi:ATP phosphoribosyltransferase regulatory subunit
MTPETARKFADLEAQAQRIMGVFAHAGYEAVAPAIIQPADVFLDAVGEALRARTYVFTDQDGVELCLRPDLTVPTCRLHLERMAGSNAPAKYCYNGPAFRFQPSLADAAHPREFRQAGIEAFGCTDPVAGEAATLDVIVAAIAAAGLDRKAQQMRLGDLALIKALLDAVAMPERWRRRLRAQFSRPQAFKAELKRLTVDPARMADTIPQHLRSALVGATPHAAEIVVAEHLEAHGLESFGARTIPEIAETALATVEDARARPLSADIANIITAYIAIDGPLRTAAARVGALTRGAGIDLGAPLDGFTERARRLAASGIDVEAATFSGAFGRSLEYYTGFVFEIGGPTLGDGSPIAGGGRYDGLMRMAGSPVDVAAVGAAIHTERLLVAITRGTP